MKKIIFASLLLISAGAFAQPAPEPMPADCNTVIKENQITERKPDGTVIYKSIASTMLAITGSNAFTEGRIVRTIQGGQYDGMLCIAK